MHARTGCQQTPRRITLKRHILGRRLPGRNADMYEDLKIVLWPDPRLKKISKPVESFDASLKELSGRMLQLMREAKGVGLAAPQVGLNIRLFVMNATGEPEDDRVYVNPTLSGGDDDEEAEEGCLSLPEIHAKIVRFKQMKLN